MICGNESGREIADVTSLPLPVVVLCNDSHPNVDLRAEVNDDSAVMEIFSITGPTLGSPPAESLAKAVQQEIRDAIPDAVVEIHRGSME